MNRNGETGEAPARNKRFFEKSGYWYYTTREGLEIGPFDSELDAQAGVSDFIDFVMHAEQDVVQTLAKYRSAA